MILSVITVVRNDKTHIENTIKSVLGQTYPEIEYVVIDGNSSDGTTEIIKQYQDKISCFISEPDAGLYDAMNKGLENATGDFVCFLNSGDLFFDFHTVEHLFNGADKKTDVIYGDTVIVDEMGNVKGKRRHRPPEMLTWKSFKNGMLVSHQAFIPSLQITPKYDLRYKLTSDFDWCIRILKQASSIHNTKITLIKYLDGGMSKKNMLNSLIERFQIMRKNYGLPTTLFIHVRNAVKMAGFKLKHGWV